LDANWFNSRRVTTYPRLIVALYTVIVLAALVLSPNFIDPTGKPIGTDFLGFWAAGRMALDGHATEAYDAEAHAVAAQHALPWKPGQQAPFVPYLYPPTFLMAAAALALLPYGAALAVWLAATLPMYLASIRAIHPAALMAALAFPAVFLNLAHGQTGFLSAGLLGGALLLLDRRPWTSGILFGLLAYKPQFGVLIPLALLLGGYWRTIAAAGLTVVATIGCSLALWGEGPWRAFIVTLQTVASYGLENSSDGLEKLQSVFAAVRLLGGSLTLAWAFQTLFACIGAAAVVWVWRKPGNIAVRGATLATASLMLTPYLFDYDLVILALPLTWLVLCGLEDGFRSWEKTILFATWLLPLFSRIMGKYLHLSAAPLAMLMLLFLALRSHARCNAVLPGTRSTVPPDSDIDRP
jgi:alpha-1,2-mannosyltransferase